MNDRAMLYAEALYSAAEESNCRDEVCESMTEARRLFEENPDYVRLMSSAFLPSDERCRLIKEAFLGKIHDYVLNFMLILAKKRLFGEFFSFAVAFEKLCFKEKGIVRADIVTAIELSDEKKEEIVKKVSAALKKTIIPEFKVDESILGGIIVTTERSTIDLSVSGMLKSIEEYIGKQAVGDDNFAY